MLSSLKLTQKTIIGKQQFKKLKIILQNILDKNQSYDFQFPVDWKAMGLSDYTFIIKNPMDLGTVGSKLQNQRYKFIQQVLDDIQLIWDNCKKYNIAGTWIYNAAENLQRFFKKMVKNYLPSIPIIIPGRNFTGEKNHQKKQIQSNMFQQDDNEEINYHQKIKFSQKIKHLSCEDIGKLIQYVIDNCSIAYHESQGDNAELLVDNLDYTTFKELNIMMIKMNEDYQNKLTKRRKI